LILTSPVWAAAPIVSDGDTLTVDGTKFKLDGKWFCSEDEARAEGCTKAGDCPR